MLKGKRYIMSYIDDLFRQQQEALKHYDEVWRRILSQAEAVKERKTFFDSEFEEEEQTTEEGYKTNE